LLFFGLVALISAFWVAICAAAPEFIWQGLRIRPDSGPRSQASERLDQ
jgi:hypothetical protein